MYRERGRERERERSICIQSCVWPPSVFLVASDRYTDTDMHVIKKRAGRRPALTKTREA